MSIAEGSFASEENAQDRLFCTKENSAYLFHWGDLAEGRVAGQTRGGSGWLWANPPFTEYERVVAKLRSEGTRVVVLVPFWPKQRWFQDLQGMSCAQVLLKREEAQYRKEGESEFMPIATWDTMLLKIDTMTTPPPAQRTYLFVGESEAVKFVREARCAAYGVELRLSGSTGVYPWVIQCVFGEEGQIPVRVVKGGGMELVMRVRVRGSDGVTFWVRALVDTGSTANLVRGDIGGKLMVPSRSPVRIVQANGEPVRGGAREAELQVTFREREQPNDDEELVWRVTSLFHEAEMEDEMILGYPWLCEHKLAVLPVDRALGVGTDNRLIAGWEEEDEGFDHDDERAPDWAVRKLRLCVDDVVSLDGSEGECVSYLLTEAEMVEAVKGREGVYLEEVKARVMFLSGVSTKTWSRV